MTNLSYERAPELGASVTPRGEFLAVIPHMRALARCLCADAQDADDLARESLKQALSRRSESSADASLMNWCFAIELEVLRSREWRATGLRALKRRSSSSRGRTLRWWAPMQGVALPEALADLASDEREAVVLVDAAGRTVEEAAAICKTTPEAIGRLVDQGRARLDRILVPEVAD